MGKYNAKQQREYRKKNWHIIKPKMILSVRAWAKKHPEKVKEYHRISSLRRLQKIRDYKVSHPEKYWLHNNRYVQYPKLTQEQRKINNVKSNVKYQKGKGLEAHRKAAREYAKRKYYKDKLLKQNGITRIT